jgi:hypothetical protein
MRVLASFYSAIGRPSVDPELMIRMLIVGYSFGRRPIRNDPAEAGPSGREVAQKSYRALQTQVCMFAAVRMDAFGMATISTCAQELHSNLRRS